jgi:hypothetical protein
MAAQHLRRVNLIERQRDQSESAAVTSARAPAATHPCSPFNAAVDPLPSRGQPARSHPLRTGARVAAETRAVIAGLSGQTALSAASLRVEMETAKHQAREAQHKIRDLKARLARTLGDEVADHHPEHSVAAAIVKDLRAQVEQLLVAQGDLQRRLRDTEEELEAGRRLNRTLMRERNSNATELGQSPT